MPSDDSNSNNFIERLKIVDVYSVEPHEEYVPHLLNEMIHRIETDKIFKDPILADVARGLVIDGTHRVLAMRKLNYRLIPVIDLDYLKDEIILGRWFRVFENGEYVYRILNNELPIEELGNLEDNFKEVDRHGVTIIYKYKVYHVIGDKWYNTLKHIDKLTSYMRPDFIPDKLLYKALDPKKLVICYKKIDRGEILKIFKKGVKLSYKTTRHIPPFRLLGINIPLKLLVNDQRLAYQHILKLKFKAIGKGIFIEDRYYEEEVYIALTT